MTFFSSSLIFFFVSYSFSFDCTQSNYEWSCDIINLLKHTDDQNRFLSGAVTLIHRYSSSPVTTRDRVSFDGDLLIKSIMIMAPSCQQDKLDLLSNENTDCNTLYELVDIASSHKCVDKKMTLKDFVSGIKKCRKNDIRELPALTQVPSEAKPLNEKKPERMIPVFSLPSRSGRGRSQ